MIVCLVVFRAFLVVCRLARRSSIICAPLLEDTRLLTVSMAIAVVAVSFLGRVSDQHIADGVLQIVNVLTGLEANRLEGLVDVLGTCNICHGLLKSASHVLEELAVGVHDFVLYMRNGVDVGELPVSVN